jgi:predicted glycogen debranching enzyme
MIRPTPHLGFGRELCADYECASKREWLVTNGIGGYASGTVAGSLTRHYHGLLVAALKPPVGRTLLVAKLEETAHYGGHDYRLFSNSWMSAVEADSTRYIEFFHLEGTTPVWTYAVGSAQLQKRVWMQQGANTTYTRYDLKRADHPLRLSVKALVNYRDHHGSTSPLDWQMKIEPVTDGLVINAFWQARPFYIFSPGSTIYTHHEWYLDYYLPVEDYRGLDETDAHLYAGIFVITLEPGQSATVVASTSAEPSLDGEATYQERRAYEESLGAASPLREPPPAVDHLTLAADQFIVSRATKADPKGKTVIAGYHWFNDWGRDTMIALPGLMLATGRPEIAARVLRTYARYVDQGMLPNRFTDDSNSLAYNTIDATLWYFEAIRAYHAATGDASLLRELFPVLREIVTWHVEGTRYQIKADPDDGLLYGGVPDQQLTWMDAKVGDWVVTPRIGKPVEVNALWVNALRAMADFATQLDTSPAQYEDLAARAEAGFARFWNEELGYCYDVLDGPHGHDSSLRPNQLLAVSLPHSALNPAQQRAVVDVCRDHLLTPHGLRSLTPNDPNYVGHYGGDRLQRDGAYHQGTIWAWLIGPFVSAHYRVYQDAKLARSYLKPLLHQLADHCVGSISEIFDGDDPFEPRGAVAQAWSVAEILRVWQELESE